MDWQDLHTRMVAFDERAFEEFFELVTPLVYSRFLRWGYRPDTAQALAFLFVRSVSLMAPFAGREIDKVGGFNQWVQAITRDTFLEYWRRKTALALPSEDWLACARELDTALDKLTSLQKELVLLTTSASGPKTYEEAATLLGVTPEVAQSEHLKALRVLQASLSTEARRAFRDLWRK
jgi:DNA-directed RNA polymerase specialized sigma24 family protein